MRRDFDSNKTRREQLMQVAALKTPGRKHQKRAGVKAKQRKLQQARLGFAAQVRASRKYHDKVAAYWRGEIDEHP